MDSRSSFKLLPEVANWLEVPGSCQSIQQMYLMFVVPPSRTAARKWHPTLPTRVHKRKREKIKYRSELVEEIFQLSRCNVVRMHRSKARNTSRSFFGDSILIYFRTRVSTTTRIDSFSKRISTYGIVWRKNAKSASHTWNDRKRCRPRSSTLTHEIALCIARKFSLLIRDRVISTIQPPSRCFVPERRLHRAARVRSSFNITGKIVGTRLIARRRYPENP